MSRSRWLSALLAIVTAVCLFGAGYLTGAARSRGDGEPSRTRGGHTAVEGLLDELETAPPGSAAEKTLVRQIASHGPDAVLPILDRLEGKRGNGPGFPLSVPLAYVTLASIGRPAHHQILSVLLDGMVGELESEMKLLAVLEGLATAPSTLPRVVDRLASLVSRRSLPVHVRLAALETMANPMFYEFTEEQTLAVGPVVVEGEDTVVIYDAGRVLVAGMIAALLDADLSVRRAAARLCLEHGEAVLRSIAERDGWIEWVRNEHAELAQFVEGVLARIRRSLG